MKDLAIENNEMMTEQSENQTEAIAQPSPGETQIISDLTAMQLVKQSLIASHNDPAALPIHGTVELFESIKPSDGIEAMLISQMIAVHSTALTQLNKANKAFSSQQADSHRQMGIKLMNLLTKQVQTFRKYRKGSDQRIQVEHVTIEKAAIGKFNKAP